MAWQVKPSFVMSASQLDTSRELVSWLLRFKFSSLLMALERQHKMAQVFGILHPCGRPRWIWPGSAPAVVATWGGSQWMEDLSPPSL